MSKYKLLSLISSFIIILILTMFFHAGNFGIDNVGIFKIRFNKIIVLALGSFSVGFATYIMQKMMKNNIIDSSFFGIASFNLLILIVVFAMFESTNRISYIYRIYMPFISLGGSIVIGLFMMLTVLKRSNNNSQNIVLMGIIFNYLFLAIAYVFMKKIDEHEVSDLLDISLGKINENIGTTILIILFSLQALSIIWYQLIYKKINVTNTNEKLSQNLGNNIKWIKIQQILMVGINISISFSLIGGVSFLGIIAANMATFISKKSRWSCIIASISAAFITALSYLLFNCFGDSYYPIGIATTIITIPYFIYKVIRSKYA